MRLKLWCLEVHAFLEPYSLKMTKTFKEWDTFETPLCHYFPSSSLGPGNIHEKEQMMLNIP